jgi:predicted nucleic acid-binding protein
VTNEDALALFDRFMQSPLVTYREEPAGLLPLWRPLAGKSAPAPRLWMDAYLAAFAIAAGLRVVTLDNDFASFEQAGSELTVLKSLGS